MSKPTIELVWIVVKDLKKSIAYYTETVGLDLLVLDEQFGWAELGSSEGARLGLAQESGYSDLKAGSNAVVTLAVKDLKETTKEFVKKGARLVGERQEVPGHVALQMVSDLDGNHFQLVQMLG